MWLPAVVNETLMLAVPAATAAVPNVAAPSLKVTSPPVGAPAPGATGNTEAVNVTLAFRADGFGLLATSVVVAAVFTTCVIAAEAAPVKLAFVSRITVIEWFAATDRLL